MINKSYTNKYIELVPSKPTTSRREKEIDKYTNAITSTMYAYIHPTQQCSRNRILENAKPKTFNFKNLHHLLI